MTVQKVITATDLGDGLEVVANKVVPNLGDGLTMVAGEIVAQAGAGDFFRSGVGGTDLPDGVNDMTKSIRHDGKFGIKMDAAADLHVGGSLALLWADPTQGGGANIPNTTSWFGVWDGFYATPLTMPPTAASGQRMIVSCASSLDVVLNATNTYMAAPITLTSGQAVEFIFDEIKWIPIGALPV